MIVRKHIKQDQHYANTALTTGQGAPQVREEDELPWEETDHKAEEEEVIIRGEAEVEEEEVITRDKMDILETTREIKVISEEVIGAMQDKHFMRMEDKTLVNMKKDNLTIVDIQIMEGGMVDMMSPIGTTVTNGAEVKMEMDMQIQLMDPWMDQ